MPDKNVTAKVRIVIRRVTTAESNGRELNWNPNFSFWWCLDSGKNRKLLARVSRYPQFVDLVPVIKRALDGTTHG